MNSPEASSRKTLGLVGLAVASSLIASTCCVLPLALVLAGITGAWMTSLTALKPLTTMFTVIAVGTLVWAGCLIFRPANGRSIPEGAVCNSRTQRLTKWIFYVCALFIALLLLFPLAAPLFY